MKFEAVLEKLPVHVFLLALWVAWLGWAWLLQPLVIDEVVFAQIAHAPFGAFAHPPGYLHALGFFAAVFKLPDVYLRLVGVVALVITAFATYRLAERLQTGAGCWSLWLLLTNPLILRGAFVLDIDNTLMMAWVAVSVCWLAHAVFPLKRRMIVLFGLWWALGLWLKFTTPWIWPVALAFAAAVRGRWREALKSAAAVVGLGACVFLAVWLAYSSLAHVPWNVIFSGRIIEMILRGASDQGSAPAIELAERAARIGLWVGTLPVLLWVAASFYWLRHRKQFASQEGWVGALVFGWMVLLGYWVIGGVIWSLARYHSPLVALIAAVVSAMLTRRLTGVCLSSGSLVLPASIVVLLSIGVLGDPLYLVNFSLRHAMLFETGSIKPLAAALGLGQLSLLLVVLILAALFRKRHPAALSGSGALLLALSLGAIGNGVGLAALQRNAAYMTSYCYGRPWETFYAIRRQVMQFHHANPGAKIMAPFDTFQGQVPFEDFLKIFVNEWFAVESKEKFLQALKDPQLGLCVMDVDFSASHSVKMLWQSVEAKELLSRDYIPVKLGTAQGWIRKNRMGTL